MDSRSNNRKNQRASAAILSRKDTENLSSGMHITVFNPTSTSNQARATALQEAKQKHRKSKEQLPQMKPLVVVPPPIPAAAD